MDALQDTQAKSRLRFITCGSVDDGKSTLLGRLLYDSKTVLEDQVAAAADHAVGRRALLCRNSEHCSTGIKQDGTPRGTGLRQHVE